MEKSHHICISIYIYTNNTINLTQVGAQFAGRVVHPGLASVAEPGLGGAGGDGGGYGHCVAHAVAALGNEWQILKFCLQKNN